MHAAGSKTRDISFANFENADLIDQYYESWRSDPGSVESDWRAFFEGFELAANGNGAVKTESPSQRQDIRQSRVHSLIYAYRGLGHLISDVDPLRPGPDSHPNLELENFDLSEEDLDDYFDAGHLLDGGMRKLRDIITILRETYCGHVGVEYIYIQSKEIRRWLQRKMEPVRNQPDFSKQKKVRILRKIHEAEIFERFLHTRYSGQKRFSLEGAETTIACLDALIEQCPEFGVREVVMGMAHRGRLNVLANIMRKSYELIFEEFTANYIPDSVFGDGDVKYHLGYESKLKTESGETVEVRLASNPSHLEAVNPVVQGNARARQRLRRDSERKAVLPFLIHGDAAFSGQGIVAETLNFSRLPGYRTGGTIHLVINNQIGFTTKPAEARSSLYCTDIAKMIEAPIFHVNGDDPLAVAMVIELALEFRQEFQRDIVIDMYCYRKHGHNETDEPMFTQPILYQTIAKHPPISKVLTRRLIEEGTLTETESKRIQSEYRKTLDEAFDRVSQAQEKAKKKKASPEEIVFKGSNAVFQQPYSFDPIDTAVDMNMLETAARGLYSIPDNFKVNPKIRRQLEARRKAFNEDLPIDWGFAEDLAYGTLLLEGTPVRLSGQDSERGTFSHRHAAFYDVETSERFVPLLNLDNDQAQFCVYNSTLSEAGVLGFDFGYSIDYPQMLCIWEAQFGDFANGAQVIIDQFITTSESKWQRVSGIVLLLPHGYEGQGPEHSSARLERFLQNAAEENIQVCNATTASQFFHLLRRQMKQPYRKPLIIMTPKLLLRHKGATSPIKNFLKDSFQPILDDPTPPEKPARLIFCSGKVYYDLDDYRRKHDIKDTALVRVEQLYPLHEERLREIAASYSSVQDLVWCQEESKNMGAWSYMAPLLEELLDRKPRYAGRDSSASPAVGSLARHKNELKDFLEDAFSHKK